MNAAAKRAYARRYYLANRERILAKAAQALASETPERREQRLVYKRAWSKANPKPYVPLEGTQKRLASLTVSSRRYENEEVFRYEVATAATHTERVQLAEEINLVQPSTDVEEVRAVLLEPELFDNPNEILSQHIEAWRLLTCLPRQP